MSERTPEGGIEPELPDSEEIEQDEPAVGIRPSTQSIRPDKTVSIVPNSIEPDGPWKRI